jgi:hypothetical protein
MTRTNTDFGSGASQLRYARRPVTVPPAELRRGDWVTDRGRSRVVAAVVPAGDSVVINLTPEVDYPNDLTVSATVKVLAWRER